MSSGTAWHPSNHVVTLIPNWRVLIASHMAEGEVLCLISLPSSLWFSCCHLG